MGRTFSKCFSVGYWEKKKKKEKSLKSATDGDTDVQIFLVSA